MKGYPKALMTKVSEYILTLKDENEDSKDVVNTIQSQDAFLFEKAKIATLNKVIKDLEKIIAGG
jgi:hypothetical protein